MKYALAIAVIIILGFAGYLGFKNSSMFQIKVEKPISVAEEWPVYKNSKYGFEISHPNDFIAEENGATYDVHFGTTLINHGNIFIKYFDPARYHNIKTFDDISYTSKGQAGVNVLNSKDGTNNNGVMFREIQSVQDSSNSANILFYHGSDAYEIYWSCWKSKSCFDDAILERMIQSIKFSS